MEGPSSVINEEDEHDELLELPPGFRFHPTDEEIIMHYLLNKVIDRRFVAKAIGEADLNKCEPWDLPKMAKIGEKEWFFFCQRDRKYPTGMRTNRATESGYWKATGKDKEIYKSRNCLVGMKKTLVFYKGRAPKGEKTNWVMHEFRLEGNFSNYNFSRSAKEEFVVSRVFHKSTGIKRSPINGVQVSRIDSFVDHLLDTPTTLPPLTDEDESKANITPSSRVFLNNHNVHMPYDQRNFFVHPLINTTNYFSSPQIALPPYQASSSSLGYHHQDGLSSMIPSYPMINARGRDQVNLGLVAQKMEHFSSNNSVMSHSQDTGLSTDNMANEITSKKAFDDQLLEGLDFSPNISDLDTLWSY
ncbi:hypothetical protein ACS0TY_021660 [Phlomoides rotata]